jgi:diguanylate cyclase (GGDEF)-like protein
VITSGVDEIRSMVEADLRPRPFRRDGFVRRVFPFAAVATVGVAMSAVPPRPSVDAVLGVAALVLATVGSIALLATERLPERFDPLPPFLFMAIVVLLRDSQGGAVSGYAALYLVPVVWFALYGRRSQVVASIVAVAAVLLIPLIVISGEEYPTSEWRRAVIMTGMASLLGWAVFSTVEVLRQQTREVALVQLATTELAHLHRPAEVVDIVLESVAGLGSGPRGDRRSQLFRVEDDEAVLVAEYDEAGSRASGLRFPLERHPYLPLVARDLTVQQGSLHPDEIGGELGEAIRETGVIESVYVPLLVDERLYGVIGVASRTAAFPPNRVRRIATIGNVGSIALANAIAHEQLAQENVTLHDAADRDALTGMPNRRAWDAALDRLERRAEHDGTSVDLGIVDLDHFKSYNDTRGHAAGDELLRQAARSWSAVLRSGDLLARIGGEEFAFVIVDSPTAVAVDLAERLRLAMPPEATCSIGIARKAAGEPLSATLERADQALYRAKDAGRDRVVVAD